MSRDADICPLHLAPSGQGGTINLGHEYREGSKPARKLYQEEYSEVKRIYYCVHCLREVPA